MHPAPSVILFTTFSGLGFGLLAFLGWGMGPASATGGLFAFLLWALGYGLALVGLIASTFHLGQPQRALLAFTQWRSSWLSREAWATCSALILLAPAALSDSLGLGLSVWIGRMGAFLCLLCVICTAMIYAQLRTVPRWNHGITPALFLAFAASGGALLAGQPGLASILCLVLAGVLCAAFRIGDGRFRAAGVSLASATALTGIGRPEIFEQPHVAPNYLMREMIHQIGRRHAQKLRRIAILLAAVLPAGAMALSWAVPVLWPWLVLPAVLAHLTGALVARWLFFAEAEHVVGLYYGAR